MSSYFHGELTVYTVMIEISYKFYVFLFHNPTIFPTYIKRTLQFSPASRTPDLCPCGGMSSSDQSLHMGIPTFEKLLKIYLTD